MSADIQKARDILAKWRASATPGPWRQVGGGDEYLTWGDITDPGEPGSRLVVAEHAGPDGALIVGTAGNPALWEALDTAFVKALTVIELFPGGAVSAAFEPIAAAIIAADERMTS